MEIEVKKISDYEWEIPKTGKMNVPGKIFASEALINNIKKDKTLEQIKNVSMLPGIVKASIAMPDAHQGYGFSIGGVAAFNLDSGIISPGGVGYDINCGVRLLTSNLTVEKLNEKKKEILNQIFRDIPSGVGKGGSLKIDREQLNQILEKGVKWAVENGYGLEQDIEKTESYGKIENAKAEFVSEKAIKRGLPQVGSLGSGNHFLEIQKVEEIYNPEIAEAFGISKNNICVMIHCGSRGLGHQVASDYIKKMEDKYSSTIKSLPDRELINAPINSDLGQEYLAAMSAAANAGFTNRHIIMHFVRKAFERIFGSVELPLVYDVAHNIAKIEKHKLYNKQTKLCVHRKGATRSFGKDREEIPKIYRKIGQPVIIPGSMGTSSYILVGTEKAEEISFGSTAHGAGRVMSRHEALKKFRGEKIKSELQKKDIEIRAGGWKSIVEEAPQVYKNVDEVVNVSHKLGIGNLVARVVPLAVMKG